MIQLLIRNQVRVHRGFSAFLIRSDRQSHLSGKEAALPPASSPQNRTWGFPLIRLKPMQSPAEAEPAWWHIVPGSLQANG